MTSPSFLPVAVAGHICLDIIPSFRGGAVRLEDVLVPGKLVNVGGAVIATGGAVSNTGQALHRLGVPVRLIGKVGDDPFGQIVVERLRQQCPELGDAMTVSPGEPTSYTVVVSPPGVDRLFLHCPGTNDTFGPDDVDDSFVGDGLFHFGYPPLMRRMYEREGAALTDLLRGAQKRGAITSLDMALPDPESDAGRADWPTILANALPHVDVFLPSLDETLYMLGPETAAPANLAQTCREVAGRLLDLGVPIVVLKLGEDGLYLRSAKGPRLDAICERTGANSADWRDREEYAPCFAANVVGTNGAGDATIAGFLAALTNGCLPRECCRFATAVGACSVEALDSYSGVRTWEETMTRLEDGWPQCPAHGDFR